MIDVPIERFVFETTDGTRLACYVWRPAGEPRGVIQIAHGMGEHAARYDRLGCVLANRGYLVVADDHRGHGETSTSNAHGDIGPDGWNRMIADLAEINAWLSTEAPGAPRVLLGHSMGAMLAQQYAYRHGATLDALVLSGSPGLGAALGLFVSHTIARLERWRRGPTAESPLLQRLIFGAANDGFEGTTGFEWLSRDSAEVATYAADPKCGFVLRTGGLCDLFAGAREARSLRSLAATPRHLPVLVFAGAEDPVHEGGKGIERLLSAYERLGLERVESRLYPGGRHEMFNETNREEVTADLLAWLERALSDVPPRTAAPLSSPSTQ